jgi:uncharacterized protein
MTNTLHKRYLTDQIKQDLKDKMVFLAGPRQIGKTTLALNILKGQEDHPAYFNWDNFEDQKKILALELPPKQKIIVLDEIHKYKKWRNYLKGLYDKTKSKRSYLITGSARLDLYSRGGDALTGRYHFHRLHPLTLPELDKKFSQNTLEQLMKFGGFPEPFLAASERVWRRWQKERSHQVLKDDLRDLERVEEIDLIAHLAERLPDLIGSPLSINSLREDLQVSHATLKKWLTILEKLFVFFRLSPFGAPKIRAVKKEQKPYMWDWSLVSEPGHRFENLVASHLLKYCHFHEDAHGHNMELRYIRDTDKREVDFVVIKNNKPLFAVECKTNKTDVAPALRYFAERTSIPKFYQVHMGENDFEHALLPIRVLPFSTFCKEENLL